MSYFTCHILQLTVSAVELDKSTVGQLMQFDLILFNNNILLTKSNYNPKTLPKVPKFCQILTTIR